MSYAYTIPSRMGVDGRKAGKCVSLMTGETVTRSTLLANRAANRMPTNNRKG
jgi:hypothetical protein